MTVRVFSDDIIDLRRQEVRGSGATIGGLGLNGIDFIEVLDQDAVNPAMRQRHIDVKFLRADGVSDGVAPILTEEQFHISGGSRIPEVTIIGVFQGSDAETLRLHVDVPGDFSTYVLSVTLGGESQDPPANFDRVLSNIPFSFKADCTTDFDCAPTDPPAPSSIGTVTPSIDYLAKDYDSFRRMMLNRLSVTTPAWTERNPADIGVTLVEALAYAADHTSYFQDAVATEAYLSMARQRSSVRRHARLLSYTPAEPTNSRAFVAIHTVEDVSSPAIDNPLIARGTRLATKGNAPQGRFDIVIPPDPDTFRAFLRGGSIVFETMEDIHSLIKARNEISIYTWGDESACLVKGSISTFLIGDNTNFKIQVGDVLIFEERIPIHASTLSHDPRRRQAVRISKTPQTVTDIVTGLKVTQIHWHEDDALKMDFNLSTLHPDPACVVLGNVISVDYGRTLDAHSPRPEDIDSINSLLGGGKVSAGNSKRVKLPFQNLISTVPYDEDAARQHAATDFFNTSQASAAATISLFSADSQWHAKLGLLFSDKYETSFVVEYDNHGGAFVRFGDNVYGHRPALGTIFEVRARIAGREGLLNGNVAANSIQHICLDMDQLKADLITAGVILSTGVFATTKQPFSKIYNPLPATGAQQIENLLTTKLNAPASINTQKRAVTLADYENVTRLYKGVDRAYAERRWTGSWYTIYISVDRSKGLRVDDSFKAGLLNYLETFRLAGVDIEIRDPVFVPLSLAFKICVESGYDIADVEQALLTRFSSGLLPDGQKGVFHPDKVTFGQDIRLSPIMAEIASVSGVRYAHTPPQKGGHFRKLYEPQQDYGDVGEIPINSSEIARLDNDPNAPENGTISFTMEGGI